MRTVSLIVFVVLLALSGVTCVEEVEELGVEVLGAVYLVDRV